jgi:6-phosphofructokinase 1
MNACIRAVVRTSITHEIQVTGIMRGFQGLIENDLIPLDSRSVSNIIQRGGTMLKTARSEQFRLPEGRQKAFENYQAAGLDALVAIGGDGTFRGVLSFEKEFGVHTIGIPGTIDNDIFGTDFTLGFDTAVNNAIWAIDRIRDTADSHDRLFFVEVMGRDAGHIALWSGIASGAEAILLPEQRTDLEVLMSKLEQCRQKRKASMIVVVCEGDDAGGALEIARLVKERGMNYDTRVTLLGHMQRGGNPTVADRVLGSRLGEAAVTFLLRGESGKMAGIRNQEVVLTAFQEAVKKHEPLNPDLLRLPGILSN